MTIKYKESRSGRSRVNSIVRHIKTIKAKHSRIIGPRQYHKQLQKKQVTPSRKHISRSIDRNKNLISSLGLDKVSRIPITQQPTPYDLQYVKTNINNAIIDVGKLEIPEMDVIIDKQPYKIQFKASTPSNKEITDEYIIVIPSYNRHDIIQRKTLALLKRHNIDQSIIKIFVANKEQADIYKNAIDKKLYGEIVIGVLGLKNQRNFIMDYYPEGKKIVQMDDDLDKIMELVIEKSSKSIVNGKRSTRLQTRTSRSARIIKPITDLDGFIKKAFAICKENGIYLWGVYPLANSRFMFPKMTTDLRFIVGPFWGIINRHCPDLHITIDEKENAERTLQHYVIDGAVLRFNNIGIETRYYKNKGGMQNEGKNRKEEALKSVQYLHNKYPKLTKIYLGKKSGVPEIRMRRNIKL
jgi:hypothetical protein